MNVTLPNGKTIRNVPEGTSKDAIMAKAISAGLATQEDFGQPTPEAPQPEVAPEVAPQPGMTGADLQDIPTGADLPIDDATPRHDDGAGRQAFNALSELAAASNKSVTEFVDFLGPDTVNAVLSLSGSEYRVPTLTGALEPIGIRGGFMDEGVPRDIVRAAGSLLPAAAGMKQVKGRDITRAKDAFSELLGFGSAAAAPVVKPIAKTAEAVTEAAKPLMPVSKAAKEAELPLLRQSGEVAAAGFKLDDAGRVVKDKAQQVALKAGVDEGAVSMMAASDKPTKARMSSMMDMLEKGKKSLEFRNFNPPQRVMGQALKDRLSVIQKTNADAAGQLDSVAKSLKGKPVDVSAPINNFIAKLENQGIAFDPATGKLNFDDSTIEGLNEPQAIIKRVVNRLYETGDPTQNAYRAHNAKKFIDEQVTYGKSQSGLSGTMEGIIKGLRRDIDSALDAKFPEYDRVNTNYADTRAIIDEVQALAGKRVNLRGEKSDKALGTMSRKILSNYNTGTAMEDLFENLDVVARRYGNPLTDNISDDLKKVVSMEAEMRRMFPTATKPNTLQGNVGMEAARMGADIATGNKIGLVGRLADKARRTLTGDEQAKINAIKALLAE
jgi:hypothetical protein